MKTILLTGGAGFIGSHLAEALLQSGQYEVICIDNFDEFYPIELKESNIRLLSDLPGFRLIREDIATLTTEKLQKLLEGKTIDIIIHLAAKAGVRPSINDPLSYYQSNVIGTLNLLELARQAGISQFIFASSSSVYGDNPRVPWKETDQQLSPISPYASSKLAAEQLGQVYTSLFPIRFTALRLFTVYGPRQRPDLAIHKFYNLMKQDQEISLYGDGSTRRDYTFVGDIVAGIRLAMNFTGEEKFNTFNLGEGDPVTLLQMVETLERVMQKQAKIRFIGEQPGDVKQTWADVEKAGRMLQYRPATSFEEGVRQFVNWKEGQTNS